MRFFVNYFLRASLFCSCIQSKSSETSIFFFHFFLFCFPFKFFVLTLSLSIVRYIIILTLQEFIMLRPNLVQYETKPRKLIKMDLVQNENYNQFCGDAEEVCDNLGIDADKLQNNDRTIPLKEEQKKYNQFFHDIAKSNEKYRKIGDKSSKLKLQQSSSTMKDQDKNDSKNNKKKESKEKKPSNSNWKSFLDQGQEKKRQKSKLPSSELVGLDCQFVKCGEIDTLARFSAVSETGEVLLDSYIKPVDRITDFVTNFSGITYGHIKNAPTLEQMMKKIKKTLMGKFIIGHTIYKDLQVCGLKQWSGFKGVIDIATSQTYSEKGKKISLKNLSLKHLGKTIQEGWHSSVEDSQASMQLFLKYKKQIMKENGFLK